MATIPSYDEWMKRTKRGLLQTRSDELKDVDKALKRYDGNKSVDNKKLLRDELEKWKKSKGSGDQWKLSIRNTKDQIVEELDEALKPYRVGGTPAWVAPPLPLNPAAGSVHLGQSFEHANSKERVDVPQAFKRAQALISRAFQGITQARLATTPQRAIYETWFGTWSQTRFATVFNTVKELHDALHLKPVVLYYRGKNAQGPTDCPAEGGNIAGENFFGAAWKPKDLPPELDRKFTYIFLGKAFFKSGMYANDSIAGVIIHELSHSICGTDDVNYKGEDTYGPDLCKRLATEKPDLAVFNADSYEYLCENFQNTLFVPKPKTMNLPKKASIALQMRAPVV